MSYEHYGQRTRIFIGDGSCPDDPRGRELTAGIEFGIPTGEFDPVTHIWKPKKVTMIGGSTATIRGPVRNPDYREYGSWGLWIHLWRWMFRVMVRGPVLGKYPPEED